MEGINLTFLVWWTGLPGFRTTWMFPSSVRSNSSEGKEIKTNKRENEDERAARKESRHGIITQNVNMVSCKSP
jgi:hypothetical protein